MRESKAWSINGLIGLVGTLLLFGLGIYVIVRGALAGDWQLPVIGSAAVAIAALSINGFFVVQPNEARVLIFLGRYTGSVRESGWWWSNPLTVKPHVSLRIRNFNSETLKVNDASGNPIEIAAVVVFRVVDSAKALFDVEGYEKFVAIQSETALRHLANSYPYDSYEDDEESLRGNPETVADHLRREVQERLMAAGVEVIEARLTHLAYAPEIAGAMLQRQQASAILAARQKIVEGAVGLVQMAVADLNRSGVIELDEERKAAMINNLMVAIIGERGVQPIINASTLYK